MDDDARYYICHHPSKRLLRTTEGVLVAYRTLGDAMDHAVKLSETERDGQAYWYAMPVSEALTRTLARGDAG